MSTRDIGDLRKTWAKFYVRNVNTSGGFLGIWAQDRAKAPEHILVVQNE